MHQPLAVFIRTAAYLSYMMRPDHNDAGTRLAGVDALPAPILAPAPGADQSCRNSASCREFPFQRLARVMTTSIAFAIGMSYPLPSAEDVIRTF